MAGTRRRQRRSPRTVVLALAAAAFAASAPFPSGAADAAANGSVTVAAPNAGDGATVTVSRVEDLVNQSVRVSWSGFRPSSSSRLYNSGSFDSSTDNPVRVYQCRGADPASPSECYGSPGFSGIDGSANPADDVAPVPSYEYPGKTEGSLATPDGPANWQDTVTLGNGGGEATIQLFTRRESSTLGCDAERACSIVVVPNYGRANGSLAHEGQLDAPWAWAKRTVVPLRFLPVDDACPAGGAALRVEGSPVASHVLASWRARTCTLDSAPVQLDYTAIGEPQTRTDVGGAVTNTGLTIDPLTAEQAAARGIVYAPVAATGLVVAFQVDDDNGVPVQHMKLNARLVAKLITGSYRAGANDAVGATNPRTLFRDPEFRQLNPGVAWPSGTPGNHALLLGDISDTTYALTRWLAADADAAAFLAGKPDPWGTTVNAHYKDVKTPFGSFPLLDPAISNTFEPVQGLEAVSRQLSIAQFPGAVTTIEDGVQVVNKFARQNPGSREVIGIIDAASAQRFLLPTADLLNGSGSFVAPTDASFLSGLTHGTVGKDGVTRQADPATKETDAYPLALQVTGAFSTKAEKDERELMARFLTYVAGDGQTPGEQVGELPAGYAPLTADLRKQTLAARTAVLAGYAETPTKPGGTKTVTPGSSTPGTGAAGAAGPLGGIGSTPVAPAAGPAKAAAAAAGKPVVETPVALTVSPQARSARLWILPVAGLLALLALLAAPAVLVTSALGRGPAWLRR